MDLEILVVDDEPEICRTLKNYLKLSGYQVTTAFNGAEALEIAQNRKIHIALVDIKMPGMDGLEVLEELRKLDFSTQVIIMTGYSTFKITLKALEKGATDYLLKPFDDLEQVVDLVKIASDKLMRWKKNLANSSSVSHEK